MIQSLKLTNFQSHDKTELTFSPRVNAIVGCTDSGKSSIIRSLCMAITNKPSGDSCIRNGTDTLCVDVGLSDGTVTRAKGKTNQYVVNDTVLKAFGQSVPEEVVSLFRIDPTICIQKQSSPYFLLHSSESERGKLLDKFCNMAIASGSVAMARRSVLRADKEADGYKEALAPLKGKKAALDAFLAQRDTVATIEANNARLSNTSGHIGKLVALRDKHTALTKKLDIPYKNISDSIQKCKLLVDKYNEQATLLNTLRKFASKLAVTIPAYVVIGTIPDTKCLEDRLSKLRQYAKQLSRAIPSRIVAECTTIKTKDEVSARLTVLCLLRDKLRQNVTLLNGLMRNKKAVTEELKKFDVCPLCKNKLGDSHGIHAH